LNKNVVVESLLQSTCETWSNYISHIAWFASSSCENESSFFAGEVAFLEIRNGHHAKVCKGFTNGQRSPEKVIPYVRVLPSMPAKLDELPLDADDPEPPRFPKPPNPDFAGFGESSLATTMGEAVIARAKVTRVKSLEVMFELDRHRTSRGSTRSTNSKE
jgi:hypothetical protein